MARITSVSLLSSLIVSLKEDSTDLKCQLHFAKEELALMCKKLTKLVSDSEAMREELARYQSMYGDVDILPLPDGKQSSAHAREAEVKVHLKLVEEETTLLSRRIVELEVENRGLRAEMCDLREKTGGGEEDAADENPSLIAAIKDGEMKNQREKAEEGQGGESLCSQSQMDKQISEGREGPVGGEQEPPSSQERDANQKTNAMLKEMAAKDYEFLLALRDHACILSSAIQVLSVPPRIGLSSPLSFPLTSPMDVTPTVQGQRPLTETLELLQAMLLAFIEKMDALLRGDEKGPQKEGFAWDFSSFLSANYERLKELHVEEVCSMQAKQKAKQGEVVDGRRDPKLQLSLHTLWILHQWCNVRGTNLLLRSSVSSESEADVHPAQTPATQILGASGACCRLQLWPLTQQLVGCGQQRRQLFFISQLKRCLYASIDFRRNSSMV